MDTYKISNKDNKNYKYVYNKDFKCKVFKVEGQRNNNFKMPADSKTLGITARYLVIQIRIMSTSNTTITIQLGDDSGNHFNIAFSTLSCRRPHSSSQMCALINLPVQRERWLNICFDLQQIAVSYWPSGNFQTLDSIEISPLCFVRDIYATNKPLHEDANGTDLPKQHVYHAGVASTNVIVPNKEAIAECEAQRQDRETARETARESRSKKSPRTTPSGPRSGRTPKQSAQRSSVHEKSHSSAKEDTNDLLIEGISAGAAKKQEKKTQREEVVNDIKEEESDDSYDDAFGSAPVNDKAKLDIKQELPVDEEEELELVYIESLNCYYCPSNQQYYELGGV